MGKIMKEGVQYGVGGSTVSSGTLTQIDSVSLISDVYTRSVYKSGGIKIISLIVVFNPSMTASQNVWTDAFSIPSGFESQISSPVSEAPFAVATKGTDYGILQARVNGNKVQIVMREKPTSSYTYYVQLVYC